MTSHLPAAATTAAAVAPTTIIYFCIIMFAETKGPFPPPPTHHHAPPSTQHSSLWGGRPPRCLFRAAPARPPVDPVQNVGPVSVAALVLQPRDLVGLAPHQAHEVVHCLLRRPDPAQCAPPRHHHSRHHLQCRHTGVRACVMHGMFRMWRSYGDEEVCVDHDTRATTTKAVGATTTTTSKPSSNSKCTHPHTTRYHTSTRRLSAASNNVNSATKQPPSPSPRACATFRSPRKAHAPKR